MDRSSPHEALSLRPNVSEQAEQIRNDDEDVAFTKDDIIIAVMGITSAGKSTFINLLSEAEIEVGHGLQSCTSEVGVYHFNYEGVRVYLLDTPRFDDTNRSNPEVLKDVAFWIAAAYTKETQLAGIIHLHRITDGSMQDSALRNLRMFRKLCGSTNLSSVILATTHWKNNEGNTVSEETGRERTKELEATEEFWGEMIKKGSEVFKHEGTKASALAIISNLVSRRIHVTLDIQKQLIDQKRDLNNTDAGQALQGELIAERKASEKKLRELKEDMNQARRDKDEEWQKEIRKGREESKASIQKTYDETTALRINMTKVLEEKDKQFRALEAKMEQERKQNELFMKEQNKAIETAREEQRRKNEEFQRQRKADLEKAELQERNFREETSAREKLYAEESSKQKRADAERAKVQERTHLEAMSKMEARMKDEQNSATVEQMKQDAEKLYQEQTASNQAAAAEQERRWEEQMRRDRQEREELHEEQMASAREAAAADERRWKEQQERYQQEELSIRRERDEMAKRMGEMELKLKHSKKFFRVAFNGIATALRVVGVALDLAGITGGLGSSSSSALANVMQSSN